MEATQVHKLAKAIAKANGHPDPSGFAAAVEAAHAEDGKPAKAAPKGKAK